jgi:hypothetical protein
MSKIPSVKRLMAEDFYDQKSWIGKLLQPLNTFMEQVTLALNKRLTISDNLQAQLSKLTVTEGTNEYYVKVTFTDIPQGVFVSKVRDIDSKGYDTAVGVLWDYLHETQQVKITKVFGLKDSQKGKYELTLYIHGS